MHTIRRTVLGMKKLIATLFLTATTALSLPASPTSAAPWPPQPCTSAEVSPAEWSQLERGQTLAQVAAIIGSSGTFVGVENGRHVYRWTYCSGSWRADLRLPFLAPSRLNSQPVLTSVPLPGR